MAKRRPKGSAALTAGARQALQRTHGEHATPMRERRLSNLVNAAYGLTPEEIELLWATAPPRMPVGRAHLADDQSNNNP